MLDRICHIVTKSPALRTGPLPLRTALRRVVEHRPAADEVELHLDDGLVVTELEAETLYAISRLSIAGERPVTGESPLAGETADA